MAARVSVSQANSLRLSRHHLSQRAAKRDIALVVSDVCGIQAQVLSAAELAVRARVEGICQQDVRDALWRDRTILKTWCMRGTLHLLAMSDLPLYVAALKSKLEGMERWLDENEGVKPEEVASISAAIERALSKGPLTREELSREVARKTRLRPRTKRALMSAWGILLRPAAYQGHLAFGENVGPKVTFVNPARWVTSWNEPAPREAMLELFTRYLRAYGPATMNDFGHWWGNLSPDEKSVLASFPGELEGVDLEGFKGLMLQRDTEEVSGLEPAKGVHLLPSFDCYVMHFFPREVLVPGIHRGRIFSREAGWVFPPLIVDGLAAGVWGLDKRATRVQINVEAFRTLTTKEKGGIEAEAADIGRFLGSPAEVRYQPVKQR